MKRAPQATRAGSVIQRQIPAGTHVQVNSPGGTFYGQIEMALPGRRYAVRVGGTDRVVHVPESGVSLHPTVLGMIEARLERGEALTTRQQNIIMHTPGLEALVEKSAKLRAGQRKVIGQAAYMTGDMIGILSALVLDPDLEVDILVDNHYYVDAYVKDADAMKLDLVTFYLLKHPKDAVALGVIDNTEGKVLWIKKKLSVRMMEQCEMMIRTYRCAGISVRRINVKNVDDAQKAYKLYEKSYNENKLAPPKPAYYATMQVAHAYRRDLKGSRKSLAGAMFFNLDVEVTVKIEEFCQRVFRKGEKLLLVWGRRSGQNPGGAHPELDTNKYVVRQVLQLLRLRDPQRHVVVIGDPIFKRLGDSKKGSNRGYLDLVEFWDKVLKGRRLDRLEQLYFLHTLNHWCDVIALGMRSGVLEGPALLGMRTLFIEDLSCHPEFGGNVGDRMEMWSGGIGESPAIPNYRRVQTIGRLGTVTEMLSCLQLLRFFWQMHPPGGGKLTSADANVREVAKRLSEFASQSTLVLDPMRKRVRFIDPRTLTTLSNPAMMEEVGVEKRLMFVPEEEGNEGGLKPKKKKSQGVKVEGGELVPDPFPVLHDLITSAAKSLRTALVNYHKTGVSNLSLEERENLYRALKDALKVIARLSPQDLKLVIMSLRRLAKFR